MTCSGCHKEAYQIHGEFVDGKYYEVCENCGYVSSADAAVPDVYWPGYEHTNQQLCDNMGRPYKLTSRSQKARVMKELGVSEAGDRVRGAPYTGNSGWVEGSRQFRRKQFDKERPMIRKLFNEWREKR